MTPRVILNADDFGLSLGITEGIAKAFQEGTVTSASLVATGDAFDAAVAAAKEHPELSIGIHLTLVEGNPVSPPQDIPSLVTANGTFVDAFPRLLTRWLAGRLRLREVEREWSGQVERVLQAGLSVDKLDSHMHLHVLPGLFSVSVRIARRHGIVGLRLPRGEAAGPSRALAEAICLTLLARIRQRYTRQLGLYSPDHFRGLAASGKLTEESLLEILRCLPAGVTEIMLHPGTTGPMSERWPASRRYHRERELAALLSPKVKAFLSSSAVQLTTYREASSLVRAHGS